MLGEENRMQLPLPPELEFEASSSVRHMAHRDSPSDRAPWGCGRRAHTLLGAFSSALEPCSPFSVLSFPEELTRHSFLRGGRAL